MSKTTIQLDDSTRKDLARLKAGTNDTYDSLLRKLMLLVPSGDDEGAFTDAFRIGLLEAKLEAREGRVVSHGEMKKRLGL